MDYRKFFEMKDRLPENAGREECQAAMEYGMRQVAESDTNGEMRIHDMMKKTFVCCDVDEKTVTLAYEVEKWELNPNGTMHGGLIGTAIDTTCGMTVRYLSGNFSASTISMTVDYLRPVPMGERLLVTARAVRIGRTTANLMAEAVIEGSKKTAATAVVVFHIPSVDRIPE